MPERTIKDRTISAVIACYNDAKAIPEMHKRLVSVFNKIGINYEIIFVNDGSLDESESILREICAKDKKTTAISCGVSLHKEIRGPAREPTATAPPTVT